MPALSVAGPEIEQFAGKRTRPVPRFAGLLSYMPLQPISEISVKLGSSAVADFGFGLRLWGCRWKRPAPRIGEVNPIKVSI